METDIGRMVWNEAQDLARIAAACAGTQPVEWRYPEPASKLAREEAADNLRGLMDDICRLDLRTAEALVTAIERADGMGLTLRDVSVAVEPVLCVALERSRAEEEAYWTEREGKNPTRHGKGV